MKTTIYNAIKPLAQELSEKGVRLNIKTSSPIDNVVDTQDLTTFDAINDNILFYLKKDVVETDSKTVSDIVSNTVAYIKNTVVSCIEDITSGVNDVLTEYAEFDPSTNIQIDAIDDTYVTESTSFAITLAKYATPGAGHPVNTSFTLPELSDTVLTTMLTDSAANEGISLDTVKYRLTGEKLVEIWNSYFVSIYPDSRAILSLPIEKDFSTVVAVFLLISWMSNNVVEGSTVRLAEYQTTMNNLYPYVANIIYVDVERYKRASDNNTVILGSVPDSNVVYVYKPTYVKYLSDGSNEAIYGVLFTDDPILSTTRTIGGLKDNKDALEAAYDRYSKLAKLDMSLKRNHVLKTAFTSSTRKVVNLMGSDALYAVGYVNSIEVTKLYDDVLNYIDNCSDAELNSVEDTAEKIATIVIFKNIEAGVFLDAMREYSELDSDLTPEDCAGLATIRLLANYYVAMLTVTSV